MRPVSAQSSSSRALSSRPRRSASSAVSRSRRTCSSGRRTARRGRGSSGRGRRRQRDLALGCEALVREHLDQPLESRRERGGALLRRPHGTPGEVVVPLGRAGADARARAARPRSRRRVSAVRASTAGLRKRHRADERPDPRLRRLVGERGQAAPGLEPGSPGSIHFEPRWSATQIVSTPSSSSRCQRSTSSGQERSGA